MGLHQREARFREHLAALSDLANASVGVTAGAHIDARRLAAEWARLVATPPWQHAPVWIHGDMHPGNLLFRNGRLAAVLDFGDLCAGDPATDLSLAWMLLPPRARPAFRAAARSAHGPVDDATWARARGWALALGLAFLVHSKDDEDFARRGLHTIESAMADAE